MNNYLFCSFQIRPKVGQDVSEKSSIYKAIWRSTLSVNSVIKSFGQHLSITIGPFIKPPRHQDIWSYIDNHKTKIKKNGIVFHLFSTNFSVNLVLIDWLSFILWNQRNIFFFILLVRRSRCYRNLSLYSTREFLNFSVRPRVPELVGCASFYWERVFFF